MFIDLDNKLSIKKLDINDAKDIWLINILENDKDIAGKDGFLYSIKEILSKNYHLNKENLYGNHYAIYLEHKQPIGYINITDICILDNSIFLNYALIREKRHHGYMTSVLIGLSNIIFKDEENNVEKIILKIDSLNKKSQKTASLANFEKVKRKYGRYTYVLTKDSQNKRAQQ